MPPISNKPKVPTPGKASKPSTPQKSEEVNNAASDVTDSDARQAGQEKAEAQASQAQAGAPAEAAPVLKGVSDSEKAQPKRSAPDEPLTDAELEGLALTAKLNEGMQNVFTQEEYSKRIGVYNEPNRVENVPADSVITWATPEWVDHGMHLNWLCSEGGHRRVHPREISGSRDGRGMFVPGRFEDKGSHVEQNGAVLCIAKRSFTEAHRYATYEESVRRREGAAENFRAQGDELDRRGTQISRGSDKVDMGRYTPMRDA